MRDVLGPGTALGYCANVHPARSLAGMLEQLDAHATEVRRLLDPTEPLGVGLWIPAPPPRFGEAAFVFLSMLKLALRKRSRALARARAFLRERGLLPITCNAFPLRRFHQPIVKHSVYQPDWTSLSRVAHTVALFGSMDELDPQRGGCSISSLPIGWRRSDGTDDDRRRTAGERLRMVVSFLARFESEFGATSTLDLEPEPGCILDTADDVVAFFDEHLPDEIHRRHVGVCHDICHAAVMFEDQRDVLRRYAEAGISVNKVQISSAIDADVRTLGVDAAIQQLRPFAEPRYLHQTGFLTDGRFELLEDLPEAIDALEAGSVPDRIRVHFHVPIFLDSIGPLGTTNDQIAEAIAAARELHDCRTFEVETYAWSVLPDELRPESLPAGIARELRWVRDGAPAWGLGS